MNLSELQQPLIHLAKKAGAAILEIYEKSRQYPVQIKADHSPLTQADLMAHEILMAGLSALTPAYPILSEEGVNIPWQQRQQWHTYWLIDPLDGTQQFIQHSGEFTVNIALIQNHLPIIGLLYVPVTHETYYACATAGHAYKWNAEDQRVPLRVRQWQSAETMILTSRGAKSERISAIFGHLGKLQQIKMSSAWKFGWVAEGKADISPRLGNTSEWDTAAGQCILEVAGGALLDLAGKPLRYNMHESVLNPHFIAVGDIEQLRSRIIPHH
jgi:3'(2'), 5'-bisphosphate nucleotidase